MNKIVKSEKVSLNFFYNNFEGHYFDRVLCYFLFANHDHLYMHCVKCRNFTGFSGVEILWKGIVSAYAETMRKLCLSIKFPH